VTGIEPDWRRPVSVAFRRLIREFDGAIQRLAVDDVGSIR
jgi:hypothetical protein